MYKFALSEKMRYNIDKPSKDTYRKIKEVGFMTECRCCAEPLVNQTEKDRGICRSCEGLVSRKVIAERANFPFLSRQFNAWKVNSRNQ
jgi:hypothetical protein